MRLCVHAYVCMYVRMGVHARMPVSVRVPVFVCVWWVVRYRTCCWFVVQ